MGTWHFITSVAPGVKNRFLLHIWLTDWQILLQAITLSSRFYLIQQHTPSHIQEMWWHKSRAIFPGRKSSWVQFWQLCLDSYLRRDVPCLQHPTDTIQMACTKSRWVSDKHKKWLSLNARDSLKVYSVVLLMRHIWSCMYDYTLNINNSESGMEFSMRERSLQCELLTEASFVFCIFFADPEDYQPPIWKSYCE